MRRAYGCLAAFCLVLLGCSSELVEETAIGTKTDELQVHNRVLSFDFCSVGNRPSSTACTDHGLAGAGEPDVSCLQYPDGRFVHDWAPYAYQVMSCPTCPWMVWFDIHPTPFVLNGIPRYLSNVYPNGNFTNGGTAWCYQNAQMNRIFDHITWQARPNATLLGIDDFYDFIATDYVHVSAYFGVWSGGGSVTLAVQTQNAAGQWVDQATRTTSSSNAYFTFDVPMAPMTPFRVRLRTPLTNPSTITVNLFDISVLVPECVPDQSNPGQCL